MYSSRNIGSGSASLGPELQTQTIEDSRLANIQPGEVTSARTSPTAGMDAPANGQHLEQARPRLDDTIDALQQLYNETLESDGRVTADTFDLFVNVVAGAQYVRETLDKEKETLYKDIAELNARLSQQTEQSGQTQALTDEPTVLDSTQPSLENRIKHLNAELQNVQESLETAKEKIKADERTIGKMTINLDSAMDLVHSFQKELQLGKDEYRKLQEIAESQSKEINRLEKSLAKLTQHSATMRPKTPPPASYNPFY